VRSIFGTKSEEVTAEWRKLNNEELNELYSLPVYYSGDKIDTYWIGGACSKYGGEEK
jgi:hypothetical protein